MSNHFAKPEWNIHNVSSCTGNHALHAVGVARAIKYYGEKAVAISGQGESSVSEGYVYEAINGASNEQLPVVFVFQDNGYGISVPKRVTDSPGRRISTARARASSAVLTISSYSGSKQTVVAVSAIYPSM